MFILDIQIDDKELEKLYKKQIDVLDKTYSFTTSDSGFDLVIPNDITINPKESKMIDLKIKCEPKFSGGYYLYPRSSCGKTHLRLKNSVGILDNSYRESIKALVENTSDIEKVELKKGERYFQLCHPSLIAMRIKIVDKVQPTLRGNGFGSSGK